MGASRSHRAACKNASEILPKSLPEASRDPRGLILGFLGLILSLLGLILALLGLILGLLGLSWRSWGLPGAPKWLQNGCPNGSQMAPRRPPGREPALGDLILRKPYWHAHGSRVFETWLSWNGKRERRESVKHCKRSKSRKSSGEEEEQEQRHREQQDRKRSQSIPSCKLASLDNRGWALARALRARARPFEVGASRSLSFSFSPKWVQHGSKMAPKWLQNGSREALGRRGRFVTELWVDFGHRFGSENR